MDTVGIEWKYTEGCWKPIDASGSEEDYLAIVKEIDRFFVTCEGEWYGPFHHLDKAREKGEELLETKVS